MHIKYNSDTDDNNDDGRLLKWHKYIINRQVAAYIIYNSNYAQNANKSFTQPTTKIMLSHSAVF